MPTKLHRKSAMSRLRSRYRAQLPVDRQGRSLAVFDRHHGEVLPARHAIAAGPDAGNRSPAFRIDSYPAGSHFEHIGVAVQTVPDQHLSDRFEDHVRGNDEFVAAPSEASVTVEPRLLELHRGEYAVAGQQPQRARPVLDAHAAGLCPSLLLVAGAHAFRAATIDDG